jgi:hypothetical protein
MHDLAVVGSAGAFEDTVRDKIFGTLTTKGKFDGLTARDKLNSTANSWLLGGVLSREDRIGAIAWQWIIEIFLNRSIELKFALIDQLHYCVCKDRLGKRRAIHHGVDG